MGLIAALRVTLDMKQRGQPIALNLQDSKNHKLKEISFGELPRILGELPNVVAVLSEHDGLFAVLVLGSPVPVDGLRSMLELISVMRGVSSVEPIAHNPEREDEALAAAIEAMQAGKVNSIDTRVAYARMSYMIKREIALVRASKYTGL